MTYEQRNESTMADEPDLRGTPSPSSSLLDLSNLDLTCAEELISEAERNLGPIEKGGEERRGNLAWRRVRYLHLDGNRLTELPR